MDSILHELHKKLTLDYLPVIILMILLCLLGILGNAVTMCFYGFKTTRKSSTVVLISFLACFDFGTSILMGTSIADLFINVYYTHRVLCKMVFFLDQIFIVSSVLILWIISIDRYLKICRPDWRQFSQRSAKIVTAVVFSFAAAVSGRGFVTFDVVVQNTSFKNTTVTIHDCATTEDGNLKTVVTVSNGIDFVFLLIVIGTFIFTYGNIRRTLKTHNNSLNNGGVSQSNIKRRSIDTIDDKTDVIKSVDLRQPEENNTKTTVTFSSTKPETDRDPTDISIENQQTNKTASVQSERNITIIMFVVSVGFCFCFMPFVAWNIIKEVYSTAGKMEKNAGIQFVVRMPYLNAVINPIIFCLFNPQYKNYVKRTLARHK